MDVLCQLGEEIEKRWSSHSYDALLFPGIAYEALEESSLAFHLQPFSALEWLLGSDQIPAQRGIENPFGRPSVQIFDADRFYIEALHWLDGTTQIHQHSFSGAFHVLHGSSIHSQYTFHNPLPLDARSNCKVGQLILDRVEILKKGSTRRIVAGDGMIHSLFHLERPSVTLVVRTPALREASPQYSYFKPYLAINHEGVSERLLRQVHAIDGLSRAGYERLPDLLEKRLRNADPSDFVHLAMATALASQSRRAFRDLLLAVRDRHGDLADKLIEVGVCRIRDRHIVSLRGRLHAPEHRFFLALLLCFDSATPILSLIRSAFPGSEPLTLVVKWIGEIAQILPERDADRSVCELFLESSVQDSLVTVISAASCVSPEGLATAGSRVSPEDLVAVQTVLGNSLLGPLFR